MYKKENNFYIWEIPKYTLVKCVVPAIIWCDGGILYKINGRDFWQLEGPEQFCHQIVYLYDLLESDINVDLYVDIMGGKFMIYLNHINDGYTLRLGPSNATDKCIKKVVRYINGLLNPCYDPCFRTTQRR